jgi:hypothetical protein
VDLAKSGCLVRKQNNLLILRVIVIFTSWADAEGRALPGAGPVARR